MFSRRVTFYSCMRHFSAWRLMWRLRPACLKTYMTFFTACICFDFPEKLLMRTYLAGKTKINWKKNTCKVVNSLSTKFIPVYNQLHICGFWEKYVRQMFNIPVYKLKVNYFLTILSYTFSEMMFWAKNNKMGQC